MPFRNDSRTDAAPKRASESSFHFLDRSARPEFASVRDFLLGALHSFPDGDRDELIARLRSGDEQHFRSATFELLLHEGLIRLGYQVSCHPDPGTGSTKRPDFLVIDPDGNEFFLEAVLASENDGSDPAAEAMKQATLGRLDAASHHAFMLEVSSEGDPASQPSSNDLARRVHEWLDMLNPDALRERLAAHGLDSMPTIAWRHEEWVLSMRAIPLSQERRGQSTRLIGLSGSEAYIANMWEPLRDAVKKKASRYGDVAKPYVIAVNAEAWHLDPIDEAQALFGEEYVFIGPGTSGMGRRQNGAWMGPYGPQNRRVSAVWIFNDLTPTTIAHRRGVVYVNPWANRPPPDRLLSMPTRRVENGLLVDTPGLDLAALYGLPSGWPE